MSELIVVCDESFAARLRELGTGVEPTVVRTAADAPAGVPVLVVGDPAVAPREPGVAHVIRATLSDELLRALVVALVTHKPASAAPVAELPSNPEEARRAQSVFTASRRIAAASDAAEIERLAGDAIHELCDVDRAACLFYDASDGSLWSEATQRGPGDARRATGGLAGFSARTGLGAIVRRAGDDPRYLGAIDDPAGDPGSELIVQPVVGGDGQVHAVLIGARRPRVTPLGDAEAGLLRRYAALIGPLLDQLTTHVHAQALVQQAAGEQLFRSEAVEAAEPQRWGDVVRVSPAWLSWGYWILSALFVASILFICFAKVSTYSSGPAVIRSTARLPVTARTSGNVQSVMVMPGDRVEAGMVLARLDDVDQRAAVDRVNREFETQLRNHMLDPSDATSDAALRNLRLELERARTALDERSIVAPANGTVSDLRVTSGQHVEPGDIVASTVDGAGGLEVVALLPGEDRPQLAPGMSLRLEVLGYLYAYQAVVIESVSSDVIAPTEARRVLGMEVAEGLALLGSVVIVRAKLPATEFVVDDRTFRYHDGMRGRAEVRVRSERIVFALVPGLRGL